MRPAMELEMSENVVAPIDHRTRVAADKRARMRRKLVESALFTFAEKGVDAAVIDDVIVAAGVSRGTFYNYFRANWELLDAVNEELMNEIIALIETRVDEADSPAGRLCLGLRLYLDVARRFPLFARFVARVGPLGLGSRNVLYTYVPPHIEAAMTAGEFFEMPMGVALDLIAGGTLMAVMRIAKGEADDAYIAAVLAAILRALGLSKARAASLVARPLTPLSLGADSLCVRSHSEFEIRNRNRKQSPERGIAD